MTQAWAKLGGAVAGGTALFLSGSDVAAAPGAPEFHYRAPQSCPSSLEFSELVSSRTRAWLTPTSPFAVTVTIEPASENASFLGEITFVRAGRQTARSLSSPRCDELARALALIVAILIDPQASQEPSPTAGGANAGAAPEGSAQPAAESPAAPPWWIVGPEVVLETGLASEPTFGERLFVGVGRGDTTLWLSSARLSFSRVFGHETSPESGLRAEVELQTARLDGCVARAVAGPLAFEPCVFFEAGRLQALGLHRTGNVLRNEPWATAGMLLRPTLTLAQRLVIGVGVGFHVPLTRYELAFTGERALHETAVFGFDGALGLGVRFP